MDFSVPIQWVIAGLIGSVVLIVGLGYILRFLFGKQNPEALASKHASKAGKSPMEGRNKYPEVDVFRMSGTFFNFGILIALGLSVLAFNWTTYEKEVYIPEGALELEDEIEIEPPRTAEPPPPPPPPPPPVITEVPDEEVVDETPFVDNSLDENTEVQGPPVDNTPPPPPPPPPPPKDEPEEIFKVVEDMPRFPGCEDKTDKKERELCAQQKMLEFIYKNIKYPAIARENGIEGTVVISFVVEKDGTISDASIVRDIGAQCGQEALRVVNTMPEWVPGKQRGRSVRVQFNLPVKFKLE